jgi:hypothetical protein
MGGIMSYRRFRERNGLKRTVPIEADPYSEPRSPAEEKWYADTGYDKITRVTDKPPIPSWIEHEQRQRYLRGELNRFERDVLGVSCWCPTRPGCATCDHPHTSHPADKTDEFVWTWACRSPGCPCGRWTPYGPEHVGGVICPSNTYASAIAYEAGTTPEVVRAVVAALMEWP